MAEARMAIGELNVPPNLEEGRDTWKDLLSAFRKSIARRYYRTRNSIRNGTWPTSTNNLFGVFIITLSLLLIEPNSTKDLNRWLWKMATKVPIPGESPNWLRAFIFAWIVGIGFFLFLMKIRQYILRMLLSYRGWLYETPKTQSVKTVFWAICVRAISGYQPSLYSCQRSLPRLPVPSLKSTLEKLHNSLKPLCSKVELDELKILSVEFEKGLGSKLQKILKIKSWFSQNYVTDYWEKYVYLSSRVPIAINSNYYGMDQSYWRPTENQTVRAARTLYHVLTFKRMIDREELPPLVLRNTIALCMSQMERIFSTTRIPGEEVDELRHYDSAESRHVIVQYKGYYYSLDVYDTKNQILFPTTMKAQLDFIVKDVESNLKKDESLNSSKKISSLTALPRSEWASIRKKHFQSGVNRITLDSVERAILFVVLLEDTPTSLTDRAKLLFCGKNSHWFDKSITMVFFGNGYCGLNVEHSYADAPAVGHCWEWSLGKEILERWYTEDGNDCMPMTNKYRQGKINKPKRLCWDVPSELDLAITNAVRFAEKNTEDLDLVIFDHDSWGKGFMKNCRISPDAFIQSALQLAYFKDSGTFAQTYEASMTRLYLNGRTETVRSCTEENSNFVIAMTEDDRTADEKINLLRAASEKHQQLYRESMDGKGVDRHIFALFVACKGLGYNSPFLEKILSRPWTLSTSQQPHQQLDQIDSNLPIFKNKSVPGGGFGPVHDDGYGVSYMIPTDDKIFFHVTSKHSSLKTSSKRFVQNIDRALEDIREIFESAAANTTSFNKNK